MNKLFRLGAMLTLLCAVNAAAFTQGMDQDKDKEKDKAKPKAEASSAPATPPSVSTVLNRLLSGVEREIVPAAEAMPEDKFSFAPTNGEFKGVRTFAQQLKHVVATNYTIAAALLQEKSPADIGKGDGPEGMTSKADIVKYLKESFDYGHKALAGVNEKNVTELIQSLFGPNKAARLGLSVIIVSHTFDHYGQIVEYLRMNGIVPPASRQ